MSPAWRSDLDIVHLLGCLFRGSRSRLEIIVLIQRHVCSKSLYGLLHNSNIENHCCPNNLSSSRLLSLSYYVVSEYASEAEVPN